MKYKFLSDPTLEKNLDFIGLSETRKRDCSKSFLNNLRAGKDFLWHIKPPRGRSGAIFLGTNLLTFDIGEIEEGEYFVKFKVRNKEDGFQCLLVVVYGAA
jgi:hypothetical protein